MSELEYRLTRDGYRVTKTFVYYSVRYNKYLTLEKGMYSDGATGFVDLGTTKFWAKILNRIKLKIHPKIQTMASADWFLIHDKACYTGAWDDGVKMANFVASTIAYDVLLSEGWKYLSKAIWLATWIFGGGAAKKNGWFRA